MIIHGDCLERMREMIDCSIDFIVCDPPYGLSFMSKKWDKTTPSTEIWKEALRICKPGSMLAAFGSSKTHHHLMISLERAGWEIRDVIMWLYSQGFPKSLDVGKEIDKKEGIWRGKNIRIKSYNFRIFARNYKRSDKGKAITPLAVKFHQYGTALKPAYEPIIICQKPLEGTYAQNAEKWGVAGINIDECRIEANGDNLGRKNKPGFNGWKNSSGGDIRAVNDPIAANGRWPANIILDEKSAEMLEQPSRFFYCAKASRAEKGKDNNHPTVKPLTLMKYILKLLAPPGNPICLDPFAGSGTTLLAAKELGINAIGIEIEKEYFEIAEKRLA